MTYKCKICGGDTTVDSANGIAICDYCGTKQALPLFTEDSARLLYERGNNYLLHNEYDKAEAVFTQLLSINPNDPELYWALVLCKYGVTYVCDPQTGKYIPTCNRTHYTPIFNDENYKKATELSAGEKLALYQADAATIDNIQKGILAVSKKEKPFDIFISYKETDANGNRTKDSVAAQRLYEKLTEAGYKVFFSRITLEDKIGTEYEPYIYAALHSSRVMLTICASKEHIEAPWVKNEWSRYLLLRQSDSGKTLLPLYFDMAKEDLPEEFALLPAYDMQADGFEEELLRGIKKLIPLPIMKAKRRKLMAKVFGITAAGLVLAAGITAAIIIPQKMEAKRLAEEAAAKEQAYQAAVTLFSNRDYFGAQAAFLAMGDYKDSAHMAKRCPIQPDYDAAMQLYYDGKYPQAAWAFEALGNYEDAPEQKEKAENSWRNNLAAVYSSNPFYSGHNFYINANGVVASVSSNQELAELKKESKAVSIVEDLSMNSVAVLYEDGTVSGEKQTQWKDIVQVVSTESWLGVVALQADGTVTCSNKDSLQEYYKEDYETVSQWKDIVMLSAYNLIGYEEPSYYALVAVDAHGEVFVCYRLVFTDDKCLFKEEEFTDIKTIDIAMTQRDASTLYMNTAALTNDGKLLTYVKGKFKSREAPDVVDVAIIGTDVYTLTADGKLYKEGSSQAKMNDVIHLSNTCLFDGFVAVLRSGTLEGKSGCKTYVHDVWLTKMG